MTESSQNTAVIIGAGPAGLTAAYELHTRLGIRPVVLEKTDYIGGISRTYNFKGNRIDIGGHRFFSKSERVMKWWTDILPLGSEMDAAARDEIMLVRNRKSRIYFGRQLFDYPIQLKPDTIRKLGIPRVSRMALSYAKAVARPIRNESNLEEFFINRFGRELYETFFRSYTEKVWGVPCSAISAEWGAQRVKGLSISKAVKHFARQLLPVRRDLRQQGTETSLIERFLYPKFGPGQMWEEVARRLEAAGVEICHHLDVTRIIAEDEKRVRAVEAMDARTGERRTFHGNWFFSSMPVRDLVGALEPQAPPPIARIASGLVYRDFVTVGLLVQRLRLGNGGASSHVPPDNWVYIQEPDVKVGRLQIFNNWSPYLVSDPSCAWVGLEYFCSQGDEIWNKPDDEMVRFASGELAKLGIADVREVLDGCVLRTPLAYPAYFGTFADFPLLRAYVDRFENLFLVGRNGMHRYNNQDHSMLTAMTAVDNIAARRVSKDELWAVNAENEYHEEGSRN